MMSQGGHQHSPRYFDGYLKRGNDKDDFPTFVLEIRKKRDIRINRILS